MCSSDLMTTFITRRSGDKEKSRRTAEVGEEYIRNQLVRDMIQEVGKEEARQIIADMILNEYKTNALDINEEEVIEIEEDKSISDISGEMGQKTTQSTRDKLKEAEERIKELTVQLSLQQSVAQAPDSNIGGGTTKPAVTPEQARTTSGGRNPPTGESRGEHETW